MDQIKVIKNEKDYEEAMEMVELLMLDDPDPESKKGEQLDILATLIEDYEKKRFPDVIPNPVEAIKFRMKQLNLKPVDLVPFLGSMSRVSEVLNGKRNLTLEMIRALESGLGIPSEALVKEPEDGGKNMNFKSWSKNLVSEMKKRGYFGKTVINKDNKEEVLANFFDIDYTLDGFCGVARKTHHRSIVLSDKNALKAWAVQVIKKADKVKQNNELTKYKHGVIDLGFLREVVRLSLKKKGPQEAIDYLKNCGIIVVIEPHFQKTYLDGATILIDKENPIIGITARYDRLDNFWFTLLHELAHISLHYNHEFDFFYDEIENVKSVVDEIEKEADSLAEEAILPKAKWEISPAKIIPSAMAAQSLSDDLGVHVAVVAGQIRYKTGNYTYLSKIVKENKVWEYFTDLYWSR